MKLPSVIYLAAQVRELDRVAIEDFGIPGYILMCRAGETVFAAIVRRWPNARSLDVICGLGNNAGDGYVVARLAKKAGLVTRVFQIGDPRKLKGDALTAMQDWMAADGDSLTLDRAVPLDADVKLDALLGTGLDRPLAGVWLEAVEQLNRDANGALVAVDIPSGLCADTGAVLGGAVRATLTVSFIGLKQGMFTAQSADHCGQILFDDLQIPAEVKQQVEPSGFIFTEEAVRSLLPPRSRNLHKGQCGHVLVIGGDQGMSGAVRLAAEAAARTGAGMVSVATRETHAASLNLGCPELMCRGVEDQALLERMIERADVMVLGPGLGKSEWGRALFKVAIAANLPKVVDADALGLLSETTLAGEDWILTPHPGEAAQLLGLNTAQIQSNRFDAVAEIGRKHGGTAILKGNGTLISQANGPVHLVSVGNPGMATAGMGDILSGIIAGLMAQGIAPRQAACAGVWLHASAGDLAAMQGERGMLASDLFPHLRQLVNMETREK